MVLPNDRDVGAGIVQFGLSVKTCNQWCMELWILSSSMVKYVNSLCLQIFDIISCFGLISPECSQVLLGIKKVGNHDLSHIGLDKTIHVKPCNWQQKRKATS